MVPCSKAYMMMKQFRTSWMLSETANTFCPDYNSSLASSKAVPKLVVMMFTVSLLRRSTM